MASELPEIAAAIAVSRLRVETVDGAEIVDQVSFEVHRGEVLALVGESGCGKTSVAMALLGHARPGTRIASGSVLIGDRDLLQLGASELRAARGAEISYVPQEPAAGLNPRHRVGDQISETLVVHGTPKQVARARAAELSERVHLPAESKFLRRYPFELSGGQQQRVAIAMALAAKPLAVVLDEPTTGLDVTTQAHVLELLRELSRDTGTAFVYVTHDLAVVDSLADRVAVLYAGRIVEAGPRPVIFQRPAHPYTSMLLASVPRLRVRQQLVGIAGSAPPPGARPLGCAFEPRCPLALPRCREEFPPETSAAAGHRVRCWRSGEIEHAGAASLSVAPRPNAGEITILAAQALVAAYGHGGRRHVVLHGVSFELAPKECLALVGESGSGKTTLGRCVAGLHVPDAGTISLAGAILPAKTAHRTQAQRQAIQIVFQSPDRSLNPAETIGDAIRRPLRLFGFPSSSAAAGELLERVRLPVRYLGRYPGELSGGEKQRVAIARSLAARPRVLVCDEITSALDVSVQAAIVALLEELRADGLSLLFITHNLALVHSIADRVAVLESGRIREIGLTAQIITAPANQYTRELVASAPDMGGGA